ncbi:hypothetical protein [Pseudonocardia acidicola]|uniref:Uncharacterized protein n=1 Tax=Pseudonocardia acidicola TaxID=2724939 RepID=A0ABX1S847_9PSEU|nr:hypothetical protein [Pseudonocardia acidicola]NMH97734.1 hypothetical protein [Pseudonocardia acidicola]
MSHPTATPHSPQYPPTLPAFDPATLPAQYAPRLPHPDAEPFPPAYPNPVRSVTGHPERSGAGLHLFLTIITAGMWGLLVWLPLTVWRKRGSARPAT